MDETLGTPSQTETQVEAPQTENTTQQVEQTDQVNELPKIKVKFNHEEKELPYEEAVQLAQKGMNYEKAVERARQEARDNWIAEQGYEWNGKPIKTEAEYKQALTEKDENDRRMELQNKGIDPTLVDEYVENNPTVKWAKEFKSEQEAKEFVDNNRIDFLNWFKDENKRNFDSEKDTIPADVWKQAELYEKSKGKQGKSLIDAFRAHENSQLKAKIAELEGKASAQQVNQQNAQSSPGSVTGQGQVMNTFFTREQVSSMSREEINKNWKAIMDSQKQWK